MSHFFEKFKTTQHRFYTIWIAFWSFHLISKWVQKIIILFLNHQLKMVPDTIFSGFNNYYEYFVMWT